MADENQEIVEAVAELAQEAEHNDELERVVGDVLESAQEKVEAAERTAEQIAEAAIEGERGRAIEEIRKDVEKWQSEQSELKMLMMEMKSQMETMQGQLAALATLEVASQVQPEAGQTSLSSTPLPSQQISEAVEEVETIIPANLSESAVAL